MLKSTHLMLRLKANNEQKLTTLIGKKFQTLTMRSEKKVFLTPLERCRKSLYWCPLVIVTGLKSKKSLLLLLLQ